MLASRRETRAALTLKSDLHPPRAGPSADPVLYGVAAGLESLFPPVLSNVGTRHEAGVANDPHPRRSAVGKVASGA